MSSISSAYYSPAQLRAIRDAVQGSGEEATIQLKSAINPEALKMDDGLQDVLVLAPQDDIFKSGVDLSDTLEQRGVKVGQDLDQMGVAARMSEEQVTSLKESGYQVFDNSPRPMWGLPRGSFVASADDYSMPEVKPVEWLKADQVHQAGRTGKGQTVAVLDSGFFKPDFELAGWKDVVSGSPTPVDRVGHGTHVAHDVLQAAPDAGIYAVKVMGDDGSGRPSDILAGMKHILDQKAAGMDIDIVNMSLGGPPDGYPDDLHPINRAVELLSDAGITVVAAAGNSGPAAHTIGNPAEAQSAIAVGAARDPKTISEFSSRGPTEAGRVKPDVVAPGEFITAWSVPGSEMEQTAQAVEALRAMPAAQLKQILQTNPGLAEGLGLPPEVVDLPAESIAKLVKPNLPPTYIPAAGLVAAPGTSFAAPLVAGVLATMEEEYDITPEMSMMLLRGTADTMGEEPTVQGKGFVDAKDAFDTLKKAKSEA